MYGMKMVVELNGITVKLGPLSKDDMQVITPGFQSLVIHEGTARILAATVQDEEEWFEKNRKDKETVGWGIWVDGKQEPIGVTSLHNVDAINLSCSSGIVIFDKNYWGKGVASGAHLARTLYAADVLNRYTITSSVRTTNPGSFKALQKTGYTICSTELRTTFRRGKFIDTYHLVWYNPERISMLFPEGVPEMYVEGISKATAALNKARQIVSFE